MRRVPKGQISLGNFPGNKGVVSGNKSPEIYLQPAGNSRLGQTGVTVVTRANVGLQASGLLYTNQAEAGAATEGAEPDEQEQTSTGAVLASQLEVKGAKHSGG